MRANEEQQILADLAKARVDTQRTRDVQVRSEASTAEQLADAAKWEAMFPETEREREIRRELAGFETIFAPTDEIAGNLGPYRGRLKADLLALREWRGIQARHAQREAHLAAQPKRARLRSDLASLSDAMVVALERWNGVRIGDTIWSVDYDDGGPVGYVAASQVEAVRAALATQPIANTRLLLIEGDARWDCDAVATAAGVDESLFGFWSGKIACARTAFRWALAANGGNWTLTTGDADSRSISGGGTHFSSARAVHLMRVVSKRGGLADAVSFWRALANDTRGAA